MKSSRFDELELIVKRAGDRLLEFWPGSGREGVGDKLEIFKKADGSPVTTADLESNKILFTELKERFPESGIRSEEIPFDPKVAGMRRVWLLDPLDGTNSFINGLDDFSILAAFLEEGRAVLGVMYFPALDLYIQAARGEGALINGSPLRVSEKETLAEETVYCREAKLKETRYMFKGKLDSGRAFLKLAEGHLDGIVLSAGRFGEHDLAAPSVVVAEAGGKITDEHGCDVFFNRGGDRSGFFVASNGRVHDTLLEEIE